MQNHKNPNFRIKCIKLLANCIYDYFFIEYHPNLKPKKELKKIKTILKKVITNEYVRNSFCDQLCVIQEKLFKDLDAFYNGDPAATSKRIIAICYPGLYAITIHRIANCLYNLEYKETARILSEYAHSKTGIDIHPGATINENFFIDHGTGVVIGETAVIGNNVKLYHGVTLGAISTKNIEKLKTIKRHPTICDNVTIYANATILGGETVISANKTIPANAFITKSE